jgi:hypothetical protein
VLELLQNPAHGEKPCPQAWLIFDKKLSTKPSNQVEAKVFADKVKVETMWKVTMPLTLDRALSDAQSDHRLRVETCAS